MYSDTSEIYKYLYMFVCIYNQRAEHNRSLLLFYLDISLSMDPALVACSLAAAMCTVLIVDVVYSSNSIQ